MSRCSPGVICGWPRLQSVSKDHGRGGDNLVSTRTGRPVPAGSPPLRGGRVPLIRSKLEPPALPREAVSRPHLLDELRTGRNGALTLVCAPAGYGKTTLLAQWIEADAGQARFAWVTMDQGDADPVKFWTYLVLALSAADGSVGRRSLPRSAGIRNG